MRPGVLIRRYKRFLADVKTPDGSITMHCANTGAMLGCAEPGSNVWFSTAANPRRKYRHTLELVQNAQGDLIAVNTAHANGLVAEALEQGLLPGLPAGPPARREVAIPSVADDGGAGGRFDLLAAGVFIEVKSVTLKLAGSGAFPDAVSVRATRHADALARLANAGTPAALVFCVLHTGIDAVRPADEIDPVYGQAVRRAIAAGVQVLALRCRISVHGIDPVGTMPVDIASAPGPAVATRPSTG